MLDRSRIAVESAMRALDLLVKQKAQVLTTSDIVKTQTTSTIVGTGYVIGRMEAMDYWPFVGSGRGPGALPPVSRIQNWIDRAGLDISAWALARKIAKEGTKAWREKKPNVYLSAIAEWEKGPDIQRAMDAAADEVGELSVEIIRTNLKSKA